jgi:quinol monooxygenase YgiN
MNDDATISAPAPVSLISEWFLKPASEAEGMAALRQLALDVEANEPDTLTYLVHTSFQGDARLQALPPVDPSSVLFFETYRDADAFLAHVNGAVFKGFVAAHGDLFIASNGSPYTTVEFLTRQAGFIR